jgi:hypothetical protein
MSVKVQFKLNETADQVVGVPCGQCDRATKHKVLSSADEYGEEVVNQKFSVQWTTNYQVVQCMGCDTITFRKCSSNSEDFDVNEAGDFERTESVELYPARNAGRKAIADTHLLPSIVETIYQETIKAMNNDQSVLAGIGIRALIEAICTNKQTPGANLLEKIDGLVGQGLMTEDGSQILHKIRSLGNSAAHEVKPHSPSQLALALDVVEHLIQGVYVLPHHAKKTFK